MNMSIANSAPGAAGALDWDHRYLVETFDGGRGIAVATFGAIVFYRDANDNGCVDNGDEVFVSVFSGEQTSYVVGSGCMTQVNFTDDAYGLGLASDPQVFTREIRFGGSLLQNDGSPSQFIEEEYIATLQTCVWDAMAGSIPPSGEYDPMKAAVDGGVIPPSPHLYQNPGRVAAIATPEADTDVSLRGGEASIKIDSNTMSDRRGWTVAGGEWHYTRPDGTTGNIVFEYRSHEEFSNGDNGYFYRGYIAPSFSEQPDGLAPCPTSPAHCMPEVFGSIPYSVTVPSDNSELEVDPSILDLSFCFFGKDYNEYDLSFKDERERKKNLNP